MNRISYLCVLILALLASGVDVQGKPVNDCTIFLGGYGEYCAAEFLTAASLFGIGPIRPGCEVEGCCPGCFPEEAIDWDITLRGTGEERFVLVFEGLTVEDRAALELDGGLAWLNDSDSLLIEGRGGVISGFKQAYDEENYPAARLYIDADSSAYDGETVSFSVVQKIAGYTVQQGSITAVLASCGPSSSPYDEVYLSNNAESPLSCLIGIRSLLIVDGYRGPSLPGIYAEYINDESHRLSRSIQIENLKPSPYSYWGVPTYHDLFVLSRYNGMALEKMNWTTNPGDVKIINLPNPAPLPVTIWIIHDNDDNPDDNINDIKTGAENDIIWANTYYNLEKTGIVFDYRIIDLSEDSDASTVIPSDIPSDSSLSDWCETERNNMVFRDNYSHSKAVNVYYVKANDTGKTCSPNEDGYPDYNVIFIGTGNTTPTLAHELGHALGLYPVDNGGHPEATNSFSDTIKEKFGYYNIMNGGGANRKRFTAGQAIRMNISARSQLYKLRWAGLGYDCGDPQDHSNQCPRLWLDPG